MTAVWLFASLLLTTSATREWAPPDDGQWKLPELKDPFPASEPPTPLPPEDELKLRDLKPLDE